MLNVESICKRAKPASRCLGMIPTEKNNTALTELSDGLLENEEVTI